MRERTLSLREDPEVHVVLQQRVGGFERGQIDFVDLSGADLADQALEIILLDDDRLDPGAARGGRRRLLGSCEFRGLDASHLRGGQHAAERFGLFFPNSVMSGSGFPRRSGRHAPRRRPSTAPRG